MQSVGLVSFKFPHIVRQGFKWTTMCFVPLDLSVSLNFAPICEQLFKAKFQAVFLTDLNIYWEERKRVQKRRQQFFFSCTPFSIWNTARFSFLAFFLFVLFCFGVEHFLEALGLPRRGLLDHWRLEFGVSNYKSNKKTMKQHLSILSFCNKKT